MAGLLTRPGHRAFPVLHQWQKFDVRFCGLTAAGTVPDFPALKSEVLPQFGLPTKAIVITPASAGVSVVMRRPEGPQLGHPGCGDGGITLPLLR